MLRDEGGDCHQGNGNNEQFRVSKRKIKKLRNSCYRNRQEDWQHISENGQNSGAPANDNNTSTNGTGTNEPSWNDHVEEFITENYGEQPKGIDPSSIQRRLNEYEMATMYWFKSIPSTGIYDNDDDELIKAWLSSGPHASMKDAFHTLVDAAQIFAHRGQPDHYIKMAETIQAGVFPWDFLSNQDLEASPIEGIDEWSGTQKEDDVNCSMEQPDQSEDKYAQIIADWFMATIAFPQDFGNDHEIIKGWLSLPHDHASLEDAVKLFFI